MNLKLIELVVLTLFCPLLSFGQAKLFVPDRAEVYNCIDGHLHSTIDYFEPGVWNFQNTYITTLIVFGDGEVDVTLENDIVVRIQSQHGCTVYNFLDTSQTYSKEYLKKFKVKSINSYNRIAISYLYE